MFALHQSIGPLRQQVRALSEFSVGMGGGSPVAEMCDLDSRQQLLVEVFHSLRECQNQNGSLRFVEVFHSLRECQPLRAPSQSNTSLEQSLIALECKKRRAFTCRHVTPSLQHSAALRAAGSSLLTRAQWRCRESNPGP